MIEIWDAYFKDGTPAAVELVRGEIIPDGLYHLVCEVLVRHIDGDYLLMRRDLSKPNYAGCFEATAGGSALKGEDKFACIKRELFEETGIVSNEFEEIGNFIFDDNHCIFYTFLCVTDCDKESIKLQNGETMSYKWVNEEEFVDFIHSGEMIPTQLKRYFDFFVEKDYIKRNI